MSRVLFTDFKTVQYIGKNEWDRDIECCDQIEDYFDKLDKNLWNSEAYVFLEYDEKTNKFTLLREEYTYELVPTKKQMEEFNNNEDTLFNNRIRKCLKLSEDKRHFYKIDNSGVLDGIDEALFLVKYLDDRGYNNLKVLGARKYIAENATEDFDKYIDYFNNRMNELNEKIESIEKELNKRNIINYFEIVICVIATLIITILAIISHFGFLSFDLFPLGALFYVFSDIRLVKWDIDYNTTPYKEELKNIEEVTEILKEKKLGKTNTIQKQLKDVSIEEKIEEYKRELVNVFYNDEFNLLSEENNADCLRIAILLKEYELEIINLGKETFTTEKEKEIQDKYMSKALSLKKEILSRSYSQNPISEMNLDELQTFLSPSSEKGISRALRQGAK